MNNPSCPICPGVGRYLGALGNLAHFRCESCGSGFHEEVEDECEDEAPETAGRYADEMPDNDVLYGESPDY